MLNRVALVPIPDSPQERRTAERYVVSHKARLITVRGHFEGTLVDMSRVGARLDLADPPMKGTTVLLRWGEWERVCTVVWVTEHACGLSFETPIPEEAITWEPVPEDRPGAQLHKITEGRKRASFIRRAGA